MDYLSNLTGSRLPEGSSIINVNDSGILNLPDELLVNIFNNLELPDLAQVAQVCFKFREIQKPYKEAEIDKITSREIITRIDTHLGVFSGSKDQFINSLADLLLKSFPAIASDPKFIELAQNRSVEQTKEGLLALLRSNESGDVALARFCIAKHFDSFEPVSVIPYAYGGRKPDDDFTKSDFLFTYYWLLSTLLSSECYACFHSEGNYLELSSVYDEKSFIHGDDGDSFYASKGLSPEDQFYTKLRTVRCAIVLKTAMDVLRAEQKKVEAERDLKKAVWQSVAILEKYKYVFMKKDERDSLVHDVESFGLILESYGVKLIECIKKTKQYKLITVLFCDDFAETLAHMFNATLYRSSMFKIVSTSHDVVALRSQIIEEIGLDVYNANFLAFEQICKKAGISRDNKKKLSFMK